MDPTIRFRNYQECDPGPLEKVWVGWKVTALAFQVRAERQKLQNATVWEAMSWWWWEEHIAIPEEERMAAELEKLFVKKLQDETFITFGTTSSYIPTSFSSGTPGITMASNGSLGLGTVSPTARLHIGTSLNARSVGSWEAEGIRIDSETHPNFLRKIIIQTLFGIKWTPITPTPIAPTRKSSQSHYARLSML